MLELTSATVRSNSRFDISLLSSSWISCIPGFYAPSWRTGHRVYLYTRVTPCTDYWRKLLIIYMYTLDLRIG